MPGVFESISDVLSCLYRSGGRDSRPSELPWAADLTGGNDSRALMAAIVANHINVSSTVSGAPDDPDVQIGKRLADQLGIRHYPRALPGPVAKAEFMEALSLTDGEFDAVEYAAIAAIHRQHIADNLQFSVNGSYGEVGRGHAWRLGFAGMLFLDLVSSPLQKRGLLTLDDPSVIEWQHVFTLKFPSDLFLEEITTQSGAYFACIFSRLQSYASILPRHAQLDLIHLDLRMERWQGRIASSTNQLWPAISPWGFQRLFEKLLSATPSIRRNGLLIRKLISVYSPVLAKEPLYTGNPAMPFAARNEHEFLPLLSWYGHRALENIANGFNANRASQTHKTACERQPLLCSNQQILQWLSEPLLAETGLLNRDSLARQLAPPTQMSPFAYKLWCRLLTLESSLRRQVEVASLSPS